MLTAGPRTPRTGFQSSDLLSFIQGAAAEVCTHSQLLEHQWKDKEHCKLRLLCTLQWLNGSCGFLYLSAAGRAGAVTF